MALANRLTSSQVEALKYGIPDSAGKDKEWRNDGNGLYIRVRPNGAKSWVLRRKTFSPSNQKSTTKKTTLGRYLPGHPDHLTLRNARLEAALVRTDDRRQSKASSRSVAVPGTFGELLKQFYDEQIEPNYKRPQQVRMYIDNRVPDSLRTLTITDLDSNETRDFRVTVRDWLFSYAKSSGPVGANRLLAIFKQATKYGTAIGYLTVDPLRELTRKLVGGTEVPGDRTLTDEEIKNLWHSDSPHTPLLRFLLLTGQRIGEAQLANWTDIQEERWLIPAEHSKNKKSQWVPVTDAIKQVLNALPDDRTKIFATRSTTGTQSWLKRWCEREEIVPRFTPHDLRRTFVTELNELGVEPYIIEKLVNHSMGGAMAVYNKAEYAKERIEAARLWSEHVLRVVSCTRG
jgi:integrase